MATIKRNPSNRIPSPKSCLALRCVSPIPARAGEREFHVARGARDRYGFHQPMFTIRGNVIFADFHAARVFCQAINDTRDLVRKPDTAVRAGQINAMGLIDEIMHYVVSSYLEQYGDDLTIELRSFLVEQVGEQELEAVLHDVCERFPPREVYQGKMSVADYLNGDHDGESGRDLAIEELLMLSIENRNPAFSPCRELFDDTELESAGAYQQVVESLHRFFADKPMFGPEKATLVETLYAPIKAHPYSLQDQLAYIRTRWSSLIGKYLFRLLRSLDMIKEEERARFAGPGPSEVMTYSRDGAFAGIDHEKFSPDRDWMPNVVMIAKSTLVWLDQLSRQFRRSIDRLDLVPDETLDELAAHGFNSLWLIGIWNRSRASKCIKQMCGNVEAEASAYSLLEYEIADDIGGWPALENLRERCRARGIRLASDMVPNHTGIDSPWVVKHPDWFVQVDHSPFPSYTFNGENLSATDGVGIYLEDHYYQKTDAAVVFKRVEFDSGRTRFIYHGNDGTSMPWNDTAQLDFLNPDTREAVMQTILHVARNFSIIRFDAAMTLAKKHVQRLWYPQPGSGGDIASRAEHGLTNEQFDQAMPNEFWREVVDRVAAEVPDTLLLAEAFWMMESYFVRTLGMHRVYNSAFMNMLKDQDNDKYRQTIKNTLEFDPNILRRFVNFMNNPDEETAVVQFGKGDKYVGVCTLMITMPGLPLFGHGQVEGFSEKYGMEYRKSYWDENPDQELLNRHQRELFPLMRRRYQFSGVDNFRLYDMWGENGIVNENVFAYSNEAFGRKSLVMYNNCYETAWGWLAMSARFVEKDPAGNKAHRQEHIAAALGLHNDHHYFCLFHEQKSGLWFIRNSADLWQNGLFARLQGYETQVYLDVYEVMDNEYSHYARLSDSLGGGGTADVDTALKQIYLKPLHESFALVANSGVCQELAFEVTGVRPMEAASWRELLDNYHRFLRVASEYGCGAGNVEGAAAEFEKRLRTLLSTRHLELVRPQEHVPSFKKALHIFTLGLRENPARVSSMIALLLLQPLSALVAEGDTGTTHGCEDGQPNSAAGLAEDLMLLPRLAAVLPASPFEGESDWVWRLRMRVLLSQYRWVDMIEQGMPVVAITRALLSDSDVGNYLAVNEHQGVVWYNKERMESLIWWLLAVAVLQIVYDDCEHREKMTAEESREWVMTRILRVYDFHDKWIRAHALAGFSVQAFLDEITETGAADVEAPADT